MTAETLEHQGFEVHVAPSGEDALRRLRGGLPIDILFTDINLAGPMTARRWPSWRASCWPHLTVVYTSGTVVAPSHCVAGSRFVPKPYYPDGRPACWRDVAARMLTRPLEASNRRMRGARVGWRPVHCDSLSAIRVMINPSRRSARNCSSQWMW